MRKTIVIIGAGQLGSRHLQSCLLLETAYDIYVIDPSEDALLIAKNRSLEVKPNAEHETSFYLDRALLPSHIDFCIIATSSNVRAKIIIELVKKCTLSFLILEKVLFPNLDEYELVNALLSEHKIKAYVNCPRRTFDYYTHIKSDIGLPISVQVSGNNWGIASNAIHFLDLFCFLVDDDHFSYIEEKLDDEIHESKRQGFIEFTGKLKFEIGGNRLEIISLNNAPTMPKVRIMTKNDTYEIIESRDPKIIKMKEHYAKAVPILVPFQSQMTHKIIQSLEINEICALPTYDQSQKIHISLLQLLIKKIQNIKKDESINYCPIT